MFGLFVAGYVVSAVLYLATGVFFAREIEWDLPDRWYRWPVLAATVVGWPLLLVAMLVLTLIMGD